MKQATIGLVGPCTSGKSTVRPFLEAAGYRVRHIAQEHSHVPSMWREMADPDVLVYLDVSYPVTLKRRNWNWKEQEYKEQLRRLAHAREHADIYVNTDGLRPELVAQKILAEMD